MRSFTEQDLGRIYRAVGLAHASGSFSGHHGPLEATAWLHVSAADLERLDDTLNGVTAGDHQALAVLRSLGKYELPVEGPCTGGLLDDEELEQAEIGIADPVALAVAVHMLATRGEPVAARRLISFAIRRTAAINLALDAADRYLAGWWSARRFEALLRDVSPLAVAGAGHAHSNINHSHASGHGGNGHHDEHGDGQEDRIGFVESVTGLDRGQAVAGHEASCCCIDHEPLTAALHRSWQHVLDAVREEAGASMFPASDQSSLYERVLDRVDARAGPSGSIPGAAAPINALAAPPLAEDAAAVPPARLTLTPSYSTVAVGEPVHVWVRLDGVTADTPVFVESAHAAPVTVTVKHGEWETFATLAPARDIGLISVTGTVADLGLATESAPIEIVYERPQCAPNEGGAWELARVEAHETDDTCKPAAALSDAASRLRGQAGKWLTEGYNSAVVGTQLCAKRANTKVCARERVENIRKCTEERDEGYENCTEKRDHGYHRCCDWAPCSWFCRALVWISNIVCVAWEWVKNVVCVAWEWFKNVVCVAWKVTVAAACMVATIAVGIVKAGVGLALLGGGIAVAAAGKVTGWVCRAFGVRPRNRVSEQLKVVAVHMALLRTGKVLLMGYDEGVYPVDADHPADFTAVADSDRGLCAIWDPVTGKARYTKDLKRNLFCAHHSFLPDGRLLVASGQFPLPGLLKEFIPPKPLAPGADADLHVFDPVTETWSRLPDMQKGRWYPTCVTLPNGRVFITSGTNGYATSPAFGRGIQNTWEYADGTGPIGGRQGTGFYWFHLYPFQHVLTSGKVFTHAKRTTRLFDPADNSWSRVAPAIGLVASPGQTAWTGDTVWPYSRTGPGPGTSVLLPLQPERREDGWTYPIGRVMILGGGGAEGAPEPEIKNELYDLHANTPATRTVEILDLDEIGATWRATRSMANGRVMPDSVLLPDGTVLVVGGGRYGRSGGLLAHFASVELGGEPDKGAVDPVLEPEVFDPVTEIWRTLCRKPVGRLYHTTAMLLTDGRVIVAGHDGALNMEPYDRSRYELELFSPPYLFNADGSMATRPVISSAPVTLGYGRQFEMTTSAHIASACLIRPTAVTHQINSEQRYVGLGIDEQPRGGALVVSAPPNANVAPPGWYLLFVVDDSGTPSMGHWTQVGSD